MTEAVYDALYSTIDQKTNEQLLDIVDNHLNDHSLEYQWLVATVLSRREVQFNIDKFPPGLCDDLYYFDEKRVWRIGLLIAGLVLFVCGVIFAFASSNGTADFRILFVTLVLSIAAFYNCVTTEKRIVKVECTGISIPEVETIQDTKETQSKGLAHYEDYKTMNSTKQIILNSLERLSCKPDHIEEKEFDEDTRYDFFVTFQSRHFIIRCFNKFKMVTLWYPRWNSVSLDETEQVAMMKEVLNLTQQQEYVSLYYEEVDGELFISCKISMFITDGTADPDILLNSMFDYCFQAERNFYSIYQSEINKPKAPDTSKKFWYGEC